MDSPVDDAHVSEDQQRIVKETLREESGPFAREEDYMGCIPSLEMPITLSDNTAIQ